MTSSQSLRAIFFWNLVAVIGILGVAANGLIVYALVASKKHKKHPLIFNQNILDLISCVSLVATNAVKLREIHLAGALGHWICVTILGEGFSLGLTIGSHINLDAFAGCGQLYSKKDIRQNGHTTRRHVRVRTVYRSLRDSTTHCEVLSHIKIW